MFRVLVVGLAATVKPTVPFPAPLAGLVSVIQLAFSVTVQLQPAGAVTENVLAPPAWAIERLPGETVYVHPAAA
jgi:hypothetical protein